jgi:hypothetical protein
LISRYEHCCRVCQVQRDAGGCGYFGGGGDEEKDGGGEGGAGDLRGYEPLMRDQRGVKKIILGIEGKESSIILQYIDGNNY